MHAGTPAIETRRGRTYLGTRPEDHVLRTSRCHGNPHLISQTTQTLALPPTSETRLAFTQRRLLTNTFTFIHHIYLHICMREKHRRGNNAGKRRMSAVKRRRQYTVYTHTVSCIVARVDLHNFLVVVSFRYGRCYTACSCSSYVKPLVAMVSQLI